MTQFELDPDDRTCGGIIINELSLPAHVHALGRLPDVSVLLPGDLVLFRTKTATLVGKAIRTAQRRGGYSDAHARWTHAAMYIGDHAICEAVPFRGVRHTPFYSYLGSHVLRFRRPLGLTIDQRYRLAIDALTRIKKTYSLWRIMRLAQHSVAGFWRPQPTFVASPHLVCSQLYADAYLAVTRTLVAPTNTPMFTPAHLSISQRLEDVRVGWVRIG